MRQKVLRISRKDFPSIREEKMVYHGGKLRIFLYKNGKETPQLAVVVSKKRYKTTVSRNHFKRQVREVVLSMVGDMQQYGFKKIIISPVVGIESISFRDITDELLGSIRKLCKKE